MDSFSPASRGFACTGWSMRAWRWLKGGASRDMTEETYTRARHGPARSKRRSGWGSATRWPRWTVTYTRSATGGGSGAVRRVLCWPTRTAKFQDGRYPWTAPPTVETLEAVQKHKERGQLWRTR